VLTYEDVAVVLITRNEERAIRKVLLDAKAVLPGAKLYVVDDSTDSTPTIALEEGAHVSRGPGQGFGPAMHQALLTPTEDIVLTVDADDTYPPEAFPKLVTMIRQGVDVAGTNRLGRRRPSSMPRSNYLVNRLLSLIASARARQRVRDVHSGQRAYRREVLHSIQWDYGFEAFPVDLILMPAILGYSVEEFEIPYRERIGETTLHRWSSGKASMKRLLRRKRDIVARQLLIR